MPSSTVEAADEGEVVVQRRCAILPSDTPESLKARVQPLEGQAIAEALRKVVASIRAACPDAPAASAADGPSAAKRPRTDKITYKDAGVDIDVGVDVGVVVDIDMDVAVVWI